MKPIFFSSFLVLGPTADDFSRTRPRFFPFYRLFPLPFSYFESNFRRFCDGTSLFSAPNFNFSLLRPVLPHTSGTSSRDLTLYYRHTSLFAQREYFSDSGFPFSPIFLTFIFPTTVFPPHNHPALHLLPPTFFLIPPHFSISLLNKRTIVRTLAQYARTRTPAHARPSGGFRLLPSPLHPPPAIHCASTH